MFCFQRILLYLVPGFLIRMLMKKEIIQLEYVFSKASKNALWNYLSTASGLSGWFADEVTVQDETFIFVWDKHPADAELIAHIPLNSIRFRWKEEESPDLYFEFKLHANELTGDTVLEVTDFAESEEKIETISLWDTQIKRLTRILGI